jgi:hypothetical protein
MLAPAELAYSVGVAIAVLALLVTGIILANRK